MLNVSEPEVIWPGETPDSSPAEAKLVLVSVDGDISQGGTDNIANGIYDFTQPCPSTCDSNSPLNTLVNDGQRLPTGPNMISETTAIDWITAWRNAPVTTVKAFFIPKSDLLDLMNDSNCIGARAYLAFGTPDSSAAEAKLVLVDVEGDITKGGTDNLSLGIYDFTQPCPSTCDSNSPLFTLR